MISRWIVTMQTTTTTTTTATASNSSEVAKMLLRNRPLPSHLHKLTDRPSRSSSKRELRGNQKISLLFLSMSTSLKHAARQELTQRLRSERVLRSHPSSSPRPASPRPATWFKDRHNYLQLVATKAKQLLHQRQSIINLVPLLPAAHTLPLVPCLEHPLRPAAPTGVNPSSRPQPSTASCATRSGGCATCLWC